LTKEKKVEVQNDYADEFEYKPMLGKVLSFIAGLLIIVLILVIYLPSVIWEEEDYFRELGRKRMTIVNKVQKYYRGMAGNYQTDPVLAMKVLTAVRDSTMADSNFYGLKTIKLPEGDFEFDVTQRFYLSFDTTFAFSYLKKDSVVDTIYQVLKYNDELFIYDTLFVNANNVAGFKYDSLLSKDIQKRIQKNTYYRPYYLEEKLAYQPLIEEKFLIIADSENVIIKDPLKGEYKSPRFFVFAFKDTSYGYIENGEKSW